MRRLTGTEIETTSLGLGCAGLFRLPSPSERRTVLDGAYAAGIRHFDTAPMYGLGQSERELAPFLRRHRQHVTVTTKFGISPTRLAQLVGRTQRPVRMLLQRKPKLGGQLKTAGRGPSTGWAGKLLYTRSDLQVSAASASLARSLRRLGTEYIDVFEIHDPTGECTTEVSALTDYLDGQCRQGNIRTWGITGLGAGFPGVAAELREVAPLLQYRSDVFDSADEPGMSSTKPTITFGVLERALPVIQQFLNEKPGRAADWWQRLDLGDPSGTDLADLLLRDALRRNTAGPVLITSTRLDRVQRAVRQAEDVARSDAFDPGTGLGELVNAVRQANTGLVRRG